MGVKKAAETPALLGLMAKPLTHGCKYNILPYHTQP